MRNPIFRKNHRKGVTIVVCSLFMVTILGFVALSLDTGMLALKKAEMQAAVDSAALSAAQEIVVAIEDAANNGDSGNVSVEDQARALAVQVAAANNTYIDGATDVKFGRRAYDEDTETWSITWNEQPYNVVRVEARRTDSDTSKQDGQVKTAFAWAVGVEKASLTTSAIAFVEARDIVSVLDFSGSMNDDSELKSINRLSQSTIEANQEEIWNALELTTSQIGTDFVFTPQYVKLWGQPPQANNQPQIWVEFRGNSIYTESTKDLSNVVLQYSNGSTYKYDNLSQGKTGEFFSTNGKRIDRVWVKSGSNASGDGPGYGEKFEDSTSNIQAALGLSGKAYPYASGSWSDYFWYVKTSSTIKNAGYRKKYGGLTLVNYLLYYKYLNSSTADLWKTPHYPFHAMKEGMTLFCDFLVDLDFGDQVGLVSYATYAKWEDSLSMPSEGIDIDLSADPITPNIADINVIQRHKQAGHYANMTAMGDGIKKAREMLTTHRRYGARPIIFLMTDGNANIEADSWNGLPGDWDWDEITDFDGDGIADYTTSDSRKQYAFWEAKQAMDHGITIHTLSVGAGADHTLMEAIAKATGGEHIKVDLQGNYTPEALEEKVMAAYNKIAGKVPPPRVVEE